MKYGLLVADETGSFWDEPGWAAAARSGVELRPPRPEELIELPPGARVQFLPGRAAQGYRRKNRVEALEGALAVAAQLPSGYTRTLLPAYEVLGDPKYLPFFGYTAVVAQGERLLCAAVPTEENPRWQPDSYGGDDLSRGIEELRRLYPENRVIQQLERCATEYGCYNAQNVFFGRWEGAVAVSPSCNAQCHGCISFQPEGLPPSPQERFHLVPTLDEIVEVGLHHLASPERIYSFGQGCEGEPLLQGELIADSVAAIRDKTDLGSLHLNTNGSRPDMVQKIAEAGLDSIRVSLNSCLSRRYEAYYQPKRYRFEDLVESIRIAADHGLHVSLNLLCIPGWNDSVEEVEALIGLVGDHGVSMIQTRTLNIDPDLYLRHVPLPTSPILGIPAMLAELKKECPELLIGNHTPAVGMLKVPHRGQRMPEQRMQPGEEKS